LLGEAPIQTDAAALKHRKMPSGLTGITGLRFYLTQLALRLRLYSAKTRRENCHVSFMSLLLGLFFLYEKVVV
jgi:hypothetical protein